LKGYDIVDTSKEGGVGDIRVISVDRDIQCMVEVKNYDSRSIPTKEV
jgi:Holliday junction resolvase-like predicted endonuclease